MNKTTNMTCISCPLGCDLTIAENNDELVITGNKCPRGKKYAIQEMTAPKRMITSTVKISGSIYPVIPIKTTAAVPKEKIFTIMQILDNVEACAPVLIGDVIIENVAESGENIVATKTINSSNKK